MKKHFLSSMLLCCVMITGSTRIWADVERASFAVTGLDSVPESLTSSPAGFIMRIESADGVGPFLAENGALHVFCGNKLTFTKTGTSKIRDITFKMAIHQDGNNFPVITTWDGGDLFPPADHPSATTTTWIAPDEGADSVTFYFRPRYESDPNGSWVFSEIGISWSTEMITVPSAGWTTFSSDLPFDFTGTGVTAYIALANTATSVTLQPINKVPAATGVVLHANNGTYTVPVLGDEPDDVSGNLLVANLANQNLPTSDEDSINCTFALLDSVPFFIRCKGNVDLLARTAYLRFPTDSVPVPYFITIEGHEIDLPDIPDTNPEDETASFVVTGLDSIPSVFASTPAGFAMTVIKGDGATPSLNDSSLRLYGSNKLIVTKVGGCPIKAVTFHMQIEGTSLVHPLLREAGSNIGSFDPAITTNIYTIHEVTWTPFDGSVDSIAFVFTSASGSWTFSNISVTYTPSNTVTIPSVGWTSFSSNYSLDFTGTGVTAYIAQRCSESTVTLQPINKVPAATGVVLHANEGTYAVPILDNTEDSVANNLLKANLAARQLPSQEGPEDMYYNYILVVDGRGKPIFARSGDSVELEAGEAYLQMTCGFGCDSYHVGIEEGANAITEMQRVDAAEQAQKFIRNGRLYIKLDGVTYDVMGIVVR